MVITLTELRSNFKKHLQLAELEGIPIAQGGKFVARSSNSYIEEQFFNMFTLANSGKIAKRVVRGLMELKKGERIWIAD